MCFVSCCVALGLSSLKSLHAIVSGCHFFSLCGYTPLCGDVARECLRMSLWMGKLRLAWPLCIGWGPGFWRGGGRGEFLAFSCLSLPRPIPPQSGQEAACLGSKQYVELAMPLWGPDLPTCGSWLALSQDTAVALCPVPSLIPVDLNLSL